MAERFAEKQGSAKILARNKIHMEVQFTPSSMVRRLMREV